MPSLSKIPATILHLAEGFSHLWFPKLCEGCRTPLVRNENILCLNCETSIPRTRYHHISNNETAIRLSGRFHFGQASSLGYFTSDSLLQHLLHELKYKEKKAIGIYLGKILGAELKASQWEMDAIVPVPLHKMKEAKRGFNQSIMIAEGLSEILEIPVLGSLLLRKINTETQTDKTREERIANVSNAFELNESGIKNFRHILLVDDVLTTGATMESCAKTILSARQIQISVATIGLAVN